MSEPKTYTVQDIERYHRGEMPAAEMHLLEKAALDDPALADMLEGYRSTTTASADVNALKARLQQRIEKDERKGAAVLQMRWFRIAALFLLIAGAGWLVFQTFSGKQDIAALRRTEPVTAKKLAPETADSTSSPVQTFSPSLAADSLQKTNNLTAAKKKTRHSVHKAASAAHKPAADKVEKEEVGYARNSLSLMRAQEKTIDSTSDLAALQERKTATVTRSQNDTIKNLNVVLQPATVPMEEVVIAKRKLPPRAKRISVLDTLKPENGWEAFDDYIAENIQPPEELDEKSDAAREVELSFSVDKKGNPRNITVTKPLCDKCDEEAIRLLKKGPKWKGKKGKVKIKFPLSP